MSDSVSADIGKYKIVARIGEGAMGVVYRALDPVLNRPVAIKVMSDSIARDEDLRGRFLREAQAAGSLQHPNVITIYDCGEVDGHLFIAMEFVEGEDLEDVLNKPVALKLVDKIDIIIDVLGGLAFAHKRGIVHRDIKPANIRIDSEGRARIMDFGIAHLQSSAKLTRTGVMVGTPAYMAPEQIVGSAITAQTDIFSVGSVLYELLSGVRPFHADTLQGVMYKIVSQPPPEMNSQTPPELADVVLKAIAKEPADRYGNAIEMANALAAIRANLDQTAQSLRTVSLRSVIDTAIAGQKALPAAKRNNAMIVGIAVGSAAVILAAVIMARGKSSRTDKVPAAAPANSSVVVKTAAPAAPTTTLTAPAPVTTQPPEPAAKTSSVASSASANTTTKSTRSRAPTADELALFRPLRTSALDGRRRAADAGASADQLQAGDDNVKAADALVAQAKISEAAQHLTQATDAWSVAERDARAAAAARARSAAAASNSAAKQQVQSIPAPAPPPTQAPVVAPPVATPAAAAQPAPNPQAEIRAAIASYAHAIESRDVNEVRRAYPGITAQQAGGFEQFFGTVRSLHATFNVGAIDVNGASAETKLSGEYDYVTTGGKTERQPVSFQASLRRDANGWKLTSVR
ncbi:MAG: serine/threonine-protein kinase [Gemmatimonadaceae bacterium]